MMSGSLMACARTVLIKNFWPSESVQASDGLLTVVALN